MNNADKSASPILRQALSGLDTAEFGLTKLEAFVMHNMPPLITKQSGIGKSYFTDKEAIRETIEACKYALEALEQEQSQ